MFLSLSLEAGARNSDLAKPLTGVSEINRARALKLSQDLQTQLANPEYKGQLFMDLDSNVKQEVFSKPGFFTGDSCSDDKERKLKKSVVPACRTVGAIQSDTEVKATGEIQFAEMPSENDEKTLAAFYEVEFQTEKGAQKGWIAGDTVSMSPSFSQMVSKQAKSTKNLFQKFCDSFSGGGSSSAPMKGEIAKAMSAMHSSYQKILEDRKRDKPALTEAVRKIAPLVGKCVLEPAKGQKPDKNGNVVFKAPNDVKKDIVYDEKVLPAVMKNFATARDLNIPGLNAQKLIEIDALARTIFAEMASCIPVGSQYSMAVARVLRNRELAIEKNPNAAKEFIYDKKKHWPGKNDLTRAASSPVQFSAWNKEIIDFDALSEARENRIEALKKKGLSKSEASKQAYQDIQPDPKTGAYYKFNESGLMHTLCPPSNMKEPYYDGHLPSESMHAIWENTVRVAVEATLYPESFNKKTSELRDVLHYTSGRSNFYNFKQIKPSIQGRPVNSDRCLNLWVKPKKSRS